MLDRAPSRLSRLGSDYYPGTAGVFVFASVYVCLCVFASVYVCVCACVFVCVCVCVVMAVIVILAADGLPCPMPQASTRGAEEWTRKTFDMGARQGAALWEV